MDPRTELTRSDMNQVIENHCHCNDFHDTKHQVHTPMHHTWELVEQTAAYMLLPLQERLTPRRYLPFLKEVLTNDLCLLVTDYAENTTRFLARYHYIIMQQFQCIDYLSYGFQDVNQLAELKRDAMKTIMSNRYSAPWSEPWYQADYKLQCERILWIFQILIDEGLPGYENLYCAWFAL